MSKEQVFNGNLENIWSSWKRVLITFIIKTYRWSGSKPQKMITEPLISTGKLAGKCSTYDLLLKRFFTLLPRTKLIWTKGLEFPNAIKLWFERPVASCNKLIFSELPSSGSVGARCIRRWSSVITQIPLLSTNWDSVLTWFELPTNRPLRSETKEKTF